MAPIGRWGDAPVVGSFSAAPANPTLVEFVRSETRRQRELRVLDVGCGAARNMVPIASLAALLVGIDLAAPMLEAARRRLAGTDAAASVVLLRSAMDRLPLRAASVDLVVAHGIWNLARSGTEFRAAVAEAARVARPGSGLFLFTFSRTTLPAEARPIAGETFVFSEFSGEPQCFLDAAQLTEELARAGFDSDPAVPLAERNRPRPGPALTRGGPVVYEGTFRRR
jgi:ubiquinone/menaquinone biosynthesis C-methylase UbiE